MGQWPTHGDESPFLRFSDSKQVTRDFRRSGAKKPGDNRGVHSVALCSLSMHWSLYPQVVSGGLCRRGRSLQAIVPGS